MGEELNIKGKLNLILGVKCFAAGFLNNLLDLPGEPPPLNCTIANCCNKHPAPGCEESEPSHTQHQLNTEQLYHRKDF